MQDIRYLTDDIGVSTTDSVHDLCEENACEHCDSRLTPEHEADLSNRQIRFFGSDGVKWAQLRDRVADDEVGYCKG